MTLFKIGRVVTLASLITAAATPGIQASERAKRNVGLGLAAMLACLYGNYMEGTNTNPKRETYMDSNGQIISYRHYVKSSKTESQKIFASITFWGLIATIWYNFYKK